MSFPIPLHDKKFRYLAFHVIALMLFSGILSAQEVYLKPVDRAGQDASFVAFRSRMIAAAERRDASYILSIVVSNIKNGFGGSDSIANFKRQWKLTSRKSQFWKEFLGAIKNGGDFENGRKSFTAPYTFSSWPDDIDGFDYHAVIGRNVNLRKKPHINAEITAKLSYNIVKIERELDSQTGKSDYPDWWLVKTQGG